MERKKRRTYDAEFKKDAIALSNEPDKTISGVERSLGIPFGIIYHWKKKVLLEGHLAFPGRINLAQYLWHRYIGSLVFRATLLQNSLLRIQ